MASFGRSFKPASYLSSVTRRPNRTMSNSPDVSSPLPSPDSRADDQMSPAARGSPILFADNLQFGTPPRCREAAHWRVTGGMLFTFLITTLFDSLRLRLVIHPAALDYAQAMYGVNPEGCDWLPVSGLVYEGSMHSGSLSWTWQAAPPHGACVLVYLCACVLAVLWVCLAGLPPSGRSRIGT